jgi:exodeoxyribonuclease V alpha subunit
MCSDKERSSAEGRLQELAELTPQTLVVIDEASMVDLSTAYELVRRFPRGTRLLLVGDEAQLPPVGFGLVYHRLVGDSTVTERLTTVHRQTVESGIPTVAAAIRDGQMPALPAYAGSGDGVSLLAASAIDLQDAVVAVWDELGGRDNSSLICTATKSGPAGISALNQLLQRRHAEQTGLATVKGFYSHWYCAGDPVVWLRNDYSRGLFNGLLGHVLRAHPDEGLTVQFEGYQETHEVSSEQLIDLALAYAITCHRAQGSQAPAVIVPLYASRVLDPSWLYTAVTRAERQVVLVGDPTVMASALTMPWAARRRCVGMVW